jgi:hypothetical protein
MGVPDADRYLVVQTETEEVLSRWDTPEEAERAMWQLPAANGKVDFDAGGTFPYAVADDRTPWRRRGPKSDLSALPNAGRTS